MRSNGSRHAAPALAACAVLALLAVGAVGCAVLGRDPGPRAHTAAGHVEMGWMASRHLRVAEHHYRRDTGGRLTVFVAFRNTGERPFEATLCVAFAGPDGRPQPGAERTSVQRLAPGVSPLEWTSATAEAQSYVVKVGSARALQW